MMSKPLLHSAHDPEQGNVINSEANAHKTYRNCSIALGLVALLAIVAVIVLLVVDVHHKSCDGGGSVNPSGTAAEVLRNNVTATMKTYMNLSADPCVDFYEYSCGGWMARTVIPPDQSIKYLVTDDIGDNNNAALLKVLESKLDWPLINPFYRECMNLTKIENQGNAPLAAVLAEIEGLSAAAQPLEALMGLLARLHSLGVSGFFGFGRGADLLNPDLDVGQLNQGGFALPDRSYYLNVSDPFLADYREHIARMMGLSAATTRDVNQVAQEVLDVEVYLATHTWTSTQERDINATYNRLDLNGLVALAPQLPWKVYLTELGLDVSGNLPINVQVPPFVVAMSQFVATSQMSVLQSYLKWHYIHAFSDYMHSTLVQENFRFFGQVLSGLQEPSPRWKTCVGSTDSLLGQVLGRYYIQTEFSDEGKQIVTDMMKSVLVSMERKLKEVSWMDEATRARAQTKLSLFKEQIGFPDKWTEYPDLDLPAEGYYSKAEAISRYTNLRAVQNIGKKVNRDAWEMTPPTVNAYYEPTQNQIVMPAGILQGLYFNRLFHPALNYGGTGATQGHEMTHGFDDQGAQFDGQGRFTNWWSPEVLDKWQARTQCLSDYYSKFEILPGLFLNGNLTLGENIADVGGIKQAFSAYRSFMDSKPTVEGLDVQKPYMEPYTNDQLFFVAYAQGWCVKVTPEAARNRQLQDPHSPGRFRVNGPLAHFPTFGDLFKCPADSPMRAKPICDVW